VSLTQVVGEAAIPVWLILTDRVQPSVVAGVGQRELHRSRRTVLFRGMRGPGVETCLHD
jgi:hypothetical protein